MLSVFAVPSFGQTEAATLRGTVRDSSQAVVTNARVTLTNVDQNRSWTATSNAAGAYDIEQVPPGRYSMTVEAPGFKRYEQSGLTLQVNQLAEVDISLQLGSVTETVEVRAETPLLESASSSLGEVVNHLTTVALPLNGRDIMQLVALTPGINTTPTYRGGNADPSGDIGGVGFSASGGRNVASEILLDGSPQEVMGYNQPAYIPPPDAVAEFKVMTNSLSAEYGRTGAAVINIVHSSGGRAFHGDLFEFLRNDLLDANDFFSNRNGKTRAPFRFNQHARDGPVAHFTGRGRTGTTHSSLIPISRTQLRSMSGRFCSWPTTKTGPDRGCGHLMWRPELHTA